MKCDRFFKTTPPDCSLKCYFRRSCDDYRKLRRAMRKRQTK